MADGDAGRLAQTLDLHEAGVDMLRLRQRREHPDWADDDIEAEVRRWLRSAPLDHGVSAGRERWLRLTGRPAPPE